MENQKLDQVAVRKAQPGDAASIHHVHVASVRRLCASDYTSEQIEAWVGNLDPEQLLQYMLSGAEGKILFVAEDSLGVIVGFSCLGQEGEVNAVYVHPDYKRLGVGTLLLDVVETEAKAQNFHKLKVSASTNALPFYQARGYQVIQHSFHKLHSGVKIPCISMENVIS